MASITIRDLDDDTKSRLRVRAAHHHRSMEAEARAILRDSLTGTPARAVNLADAIRRRFGKTGGVDLKLPRREPIRKPPSPRK